jgi:hypothetical protein
MTTRVLDENVLVILIITSSTSRTLFLTYISCNTYLDKLFWDCAILGQMGRSVRSKAPTSRWQFLTNHAYVLLAVTRQPDIRISEIADVVGITERAAHRVLMDLVKDGYVSVSKNGRRNHYKTQADLPLRHPAYRDYAVSSLLAALSHPSKRPNGTVDRQTGP